jgi:hypothetical protein
VWTLSNPDRLRERIELAEREQADEWRLDSIGEDAKGRIYYLTPDNRLYCRADPPPPEPEWKPKANTKKAKAAARAARRSSVAHTRVIESDADTGDDTVVDKEEEIIEDKKDGTKWECLAVSLDDYRDIIDRFRKSRNANEKGLYAYFAETVLPIIEKADAKQRLEEIKREKELETLRILASAKRSSRIRDKSDRDKQEKEQKEAEERERLEQFKAAKEEESRQKMERARESRMRSREKRIQEREQRRREQEIALAELKENTDRLEQEQLDEAGERKKSARQLKWEIEKVNSALQAYEEEEEEDWFFDCSGCGVYGENLDDGTHVVACEQCNVWQHSKCLGIKKEDAESADFNFVCQRCILKKQREEEQKRLEEERKKRAAESPKITLKLKFGAAQSSSPPSATKLHNVTNGTANGNHQQKQESRDTATNQGLPPPMFVWKANQSPSTMASQHQTTGPQHHSAMLKSEDISNVTQTPHPPTYVMTTSRPLDAQQGSPMEGIVKTSVADVTPPTHFDTNGIKPDQVHSKQLDVEAHPATAIITQSNPHSLESISTVETSRSIGNGFELNRLSSQASQPSSHVKPLSNVPQRSTELNGMSGPSTVGSIGPLPQPQTPKISILAGQDPSSESNGHYRSSAPTPTPVPSSAPAPSAPAPSAPPTLAVQTPSSVSEVATTNSKDVPLNVP